MARKPLTIEELTTTLTGKTDILTLDDLVAMYYDLANAGRLADTVKKFIVNSLLAGNKIDGYKLVHSKGRGGISDNVEATRRLLEYFKEKQDTTVDICTVLAPVSLEHLKDLLGADVVADVFNGLIIQSGGDGKDLAFAPVADARIEVVPTKKED